MKNLIQTLIVAFFTLQLNAQPATPQPPSTKTSSHSSSTSISKTDDDYRIKARFHKSRHDAVKSLLTDKLGKDGLSVDGNTYTWSHGSNNFECKLTKTSMRLYLDYASANDAFIEHVADIGEQLKYVISGGDPQEDMRQAEADVERAQQELERAKQRLAKKKN